MLSGAPTRRGRLNLLRKQASIQNIPETRFGMKDKVVSRVEDLEGEKGEQSIGGEIS